MELWEDPVGVWLETCTLQGGETPTTDARDAYNAWAKDQRMDEMGKVAFGRVVTKRVGKAEQVMRDGERFRVYPLTLKKEATYDAAFEDEEARRRAYTELADKLRQKRDQEAKK